MYPQRGCLSDLIWHSQIVTSRNSVDSDFDCDMQNIFKDLEDVLAQDSRFMAEGKILKNVVVEAALKPDAGLIKLLLANDVIRKHFFLDVEGTIVFDKVKFQDFVSNKQFLPNSYTAFRNKIGLFDRNNKLMTDNKDVVLAWAYKDCVLEGGMTKEEAARDEVFYNTTLAPDEITRLFDPKVFTNFEYWDSEAVKADKPKPVTDIKQSENLLIKGNNLIALHSLKKRYAGQVKLIYIDPPYNTGGDSFKYNDSFNHSTWLTFMKNRLEIAHDFLKKDGAIFISIDDNEISYLNVLMDEIFGRDNFVACIAVKRGSVTGHKTINVGVVNVTEYVVIYAKDKNLWSPNKVYKPRDRNDRYDNFIMNRNNPISDWEFCSLLDAFSDFKNIPKLQLKKKLGGDFEKEIYDFVKENASAVIQFAYPDETKVSKEAQALIKISKKDKDTVYLLSRDNDPDIYLKGGQRLLFYSDRLIEIDGELVTGELVSDLWDDVLPNDLHNEGGVSLKKGKKPEKLIKRIIELATNKNDLILDFFSGSGTTPSVAHKMGRRWLAIEQMNYIKDLPEARLKNVLNGDKTGVSKAVNWQGGGDFIYCEIAKWNERYVQNIHAAKTTKDLIKIHENMKDEAFFRYDVDMKPFAEKEFAALDFKDQQKALISCLEMNHLYVNYSEIDDKTYAVSDSDKKLNRQFYAPDKD